MPAIGDVRLDGDFEPEKLDFHNWLVSPPPAEIAGNSLYRQLQAAQDILKARFTTHRLETRERIQVDQPAVPFDEGRIQPVQRFINLVPVGFGWPA